MTEKLYISAQQLLEDSLELGKKVILSGFRPNYIVGVWRGGTPVGICVQELLDFYRIETDHIAIRTSSYSGIEKRESNIRVHGLSYITRAMNPEDSLLIVDDVFDTGLSVQAVMTALEKRSRRNMPQDIRIATAYFKPTRNKTNFEPHYYTHKTAQWLVFPHEMDGLSREEMRVNKPYLLSVTDEIDRHLKIER